jgi:uncharacterized protein (DUF983 family)
MKINVIDRYRKYIATLAQVCDDDEMDYTMQKIEQVWMLFVIIIIIIIIILMCMRWCVAVVHFITIFSRQILTLFYVHPPTNPELQQLQCVPISIQSD